MQITVESANCNWKLQTYLSVLCMGVKWMTVSALTLYWSRVQRVLSSHLFWLGHQMAWSDQSIAISETREVMSIL